MDFRVWTPGGVFDPSAPVPAAPVPVAPASSSSVGNFTCPGCKLGPFTSQDQWLQHLRSEAHQETKRRGPNGRKAQQDGGRRNWDIAKSLQLTKTGGILAANILNYVAQWGQVQDFSYLAKRDGTANECFILMQSIESVMLMLRTNKPHIINGKTIGITLCKETKHMGSEQLRQKQNAILETWQNAEAQGLQGGLQIDGSFYCKLCDLKLRPDQQNWLQHLKSVQHLAKHRDVQFLRRTEWDLDKTVEIVRVKGLPSIRILNYLATWGHLQDFSYLAKHDGGCPACHALFQSVETVNKITNVRHPLLSKRANIIAITDELKLKWRKPEFKNSQRAGGAVSSSDAQIINEEDVLILSSDEHFSDDDGSCGANSMNNAGGGGSSTSNSASFMGPIRDEAPDTQRERTSTMDCVTCNFQTVSLERWHAHLCSVEHRQLKSKEPGHGLRYWTSQNAIRLSGVKSVTKTDIVQFGNSWGHLLDFIYQSDKDGLLDDCYLLYPSKETAGQILTSKGYLVIGSRKVEAHPVPQYAGYRKKEVKKLMTEKLYHDKIVAKESPEELLRKEMQNLYRTLAGKSLADQIDLFVKLIIWNEEFVRSSQKLIHEDLKLIFSKAVHPLSSALFIPYGAFVTKMGLKLQPFIQILVSFKGSSTEPQLIHKIRKAIESAPPSGNLIPVQASIHSFPLSDSSTIAECIFSNVANQSEVTLRLGNTLPLLESQLIALYCKLDARVYPLMMLILHWSHTHKALVVKDELLLNQVILLLVVFFLEQKKIVPTVDRICCLASSENDTPNIISGFNVSFCKDVTIIGVNQLGMLNDPTIKALSVLGLMKEFFAFFSQADLSKNVICTRFGEMIPKEDFKPGNIGQLPGEIARQYRFGSDGQSRMGFLFTETDLCVQDPFLLNINLTKNTTLEECCKFKDLCTTANDKLETMMTSEAPSLVDFLIPNELRTSFETYEPPSPKRMKLNVEDEMDAGSEATPTGSYTFQSDTNVKAVGEWDSNWDAFNHGDGDQDDSELYDDIEEGGEGGDQSFASLDLNPNLQKYFARSFIPERDHPNRQLVLQKLQTLGLQFFLDFNSRFWKNCFGLSFEPKIGFNFMSSPYVEIQDPPQYTLQQRLDEIDLNEKSIKVPFRVTSRLGQKVHKVLCEPPELVSFKGFEGQRELAILMYAASNLEVSSVQDTLFLPMNDPANHIEFEGELSGEVLPIVNGKISLARLKINHKGDERMNSKIGLLKRLFHRMGHKYLNTMVKRWLSSCTDFDRKKADSNVKAINQQWNKKANKKNKGREKGGRGRGGGGGRGGRGRGGGGGLGRGAPGGRSFGGQTSQQQPPLLANPYSAGPSHGEAARNYYTPSGEPSYGGSSYSLNAQRSPPPPPPPPQISPGPAGRGYGRGRGNNFNASAPGTGPSYGRGRGSGFNSDGPSRINYGSPSRFDYNNPVTEQRYGEGSNNFNTGSNSGPRNSNFGGPGQVLPGQLQGYGITPGGYQGMMQGGQSARGSRAPRYFQNQNQSHPFGQGQEQSYSYHPPSQPY